LSEGASVSEATPVGPGTRVTLEFSLKLDSGEVVDSTQGKPAVFQVGDGSLLPGFEYALYGMKAGENQAISLCADRAFGPVEKDNIRIMNRHDFPAEAVLTEGLVYSFAEPGGTELPGVIIGLEHDNVRVDFNHPLAGHDLVFEVKILKVEQVSNRIA